MDYREKTRPLISSGKALFMLLLQPMYTLGKTGTAGLHTEKANRVIVVNTLSIISALLAGTFACFIFLKSGDYSILIAGLSEMLFFSLFLLLNHYRQHRLSILCFLLLHNAALFYFAVFRGMVMEERMLAVFLFICSLLLFSPWWQIMSSIGLSAGILLFAKLNQQFALLPAHPLEATAVGPFNELSTVALLVLIFVSVGLFKKQNVQLIRQLRSSNKNLDARTVALEQANNNVRFFFNQLSHDMRDKLNALVGINDLLQADIKTQQYAALGFYAGRQRIAINSLLEMVSDILTLKMIESGQYQEAVLETIELRPWLKDLVDIAQYNADPQLIKIHLIADDKLPAYIVTDPVKLDKILSNLLNNAIKYTDAIVLLKVFVKEDRLQFVIVDKGKGINPEQLPHIFNKNYTGNTGKGNGLGLYIVKWLCELLQLNISVDSRPGKGSTFQIDMPLVTGKAEHCWRETPSIPKTTLLEGKRILVADDVFENRFVLEKNLQASGCTVFLAQNGAEVLELARRELPDLIILDSQMPVMGGKETLEHIRKDSRLRDTRVILITATSLQANMDPLLEADADDYFMKPINMEHLKLAISRLLSRPPLSRA